MDEYDEYYDYDDPDNTLDIETIIQIAFDELYKDIKSCRYISLSPEHEISINFSMEPFGFSILK